MSKALIAACTAGFLSSGLYVLVFGVGLGFLFLFLPTLPLFSLGLSKRPANMSIAVSVATIAIMLVGGSAMAVLYGLFLGLPALYICKYSAYRIRFSTTLGDANLWFPIGTIIFHLTLYGCAFFSLTMVYYHFQGTSLPAQLSESIRLTFADLQQEYGDIIDTLANGLAFLMFPVTLWMWGLLLYSHAWFSNRMLIKRKLNTRPNFAITPFIIPSWAISLLAIAALASLIGSEEMRFFGKVTVLSLMLPYFFLGVSIMHAASRNMPSRSFLLFFVYFMVLSQFWPALILSGVGLWQQIKSFRLESSPK